jgi:UDP-N-acetylglucosamine--N-acetylmuramyl-(pentapeptide) pyrophosphoryl-undecaprenol N-acetylglucosamine transferase
MKIVITGAGGGHFYPLIAVIERVFKETFIQKIIQPDVYFFSDAPYDEKVLFETQVKFVHIPAGKLRIYPSLENFFDAIKTAWGCFVAIIKLYHYYPDVVFAKGGYASFPTLFAAKLLSIPVIVHESDTIPGRTTLFAGKFAMRVAISYPEAASYYNTSTLALTGQPIRDVYLPPENYKRTYEHRQRPVIMVLCGSQGSQRINEMIVNILPELLNTYDIVHQVGPGNVEVMRQLTKERLHGHPYEEHYFMDGFIDLSLFYPKVDLVITRGSSAMFEMAMWQLPMIVIPLPPTVSRDQTSNAYAMASRGVASVIEEGNASPSILFAEISRILSIQDTYKHMSEAGLKFENCRTAAHTIAREIIRIGLSHSEE